MEKQFSFSSFLKRSLTACIPIAGYRRKLRKKWLNSSVPSSLKKFIRSQGLSGDSESLIQGLGIVEGEKPLVSIIVPNYNHAPYLRQRLDSIYQQTYTNIEVILMDDCSTDDSRDILEEYRSRFPDKTITLFNETNSGHVFSQWAKGISHAKGDLVWMAESDDYCDSRFLETLVPFFSLPAVSLAYARTDFVQNGKKIWSIEEYLNDLSPTKWHQPFIDTSQHFVANYHSVKNVIPNASSVLFRNRKCFDILHDETLRQLKLCGDWLIYLSILRGGLVAYSSKTTNYYRIHEKSTSLKIQKEQTYFSEHAIIARALKSWYHIPHESFLKLESQLKTKYAQDGIDSFAFADIFNLKLLDEAPSFLNIILCTAGFSQGGGETYPIYVANALREKGHTVSLFDFQLLPESKGIRSLLRDDIPVFRFTPGQAENEKNIKELIAKLDPDIIHTHHLQTDSIISDIRKSLPFRHVVNLHGMYEAVDETFWKNCNISLPSLHQTVDHFIYTADKGLAYFTDQQFSVDNFTKILNGLPRLPYQPVKRSELHVPEEAFLICLVSRGIPTKGWYEGIEAVMKANGHSARPVYLIIVGTGECYDSLLAEMDESVKKYVRLLGFKSNLRDYFSAADIGFLPTYFPGESCPLVLIDCLMAGKPFLVSDIGETRNQMLTSSGAFAGDVVPLVDGKPNIEIFADRIVEWANNPESYQSILSRVNEVAEKMEIGYVSSLYESIYWDLVSDRNNSTVK